MAGCSLFQAELYGGPDQPGRPTPPLDWLCPLRLGCARNRGAMKIIALLFLLFAALLVAGCATGTLDGQEADSLEEAKK